MNELNALPFSNYSVASRQNHYVIPDADAIAEAIFGNPVKFYLSKHSSFANVESSTLDIESQGERIGEGIYPVKYAEGMRRKAAI